MKKLFLFLIAACSLSSCAPVGVLSGRVNYDQPEATLMYPRREASFAVDKITDPEIIKQSFIDMR